MLMLKKFWEQNKHQLQLVGILIGVGALFLSIPIPEIEEAAEALKKIQLIWLLIVTISTGLLFVNLHKLSRLYEIDSTKDKDGFNFDETISIVIGLTIAYFISNMWIYAYSLYREVIFDFIETVQFGITAFLVAVTYHCWRKIVLKFENHNPKLRVCIAITGHAINALLLGAWLHVSINSWEFVLNEWLYWSVGTFVVMMAMGLMIDWKRKSESARDTIEPETEK